MGGHLQEKKTTEMLRGWWGGGRRVRRDRKKAKTSMSSDYTGVAAVVRIALLLPKKTRQ